MDRSSGGQTALRSTSRDLRDPGRRMLGGPLGAPAWILLLCWGLAARCTGAMALPPPSITILRMPAEPPPPGESVTVSCEALSGLPELTLLYWLENGSFVESLHPDGAVREGTVHRFLGIHISFVRSQKNHTLIFTKENTVRNCSCSVAIRDCDYCLANLMCNCKTVLPSTMEKTTYNSHLTIWFTDTSVLEMVLSFTRLWDLKLSFCGTTPLPTEYLAIWGLRKLRVNKVKGQFPEQSVTICGNNNHDQEDLLEVHNKDRQMLAHISFLDTSLFNGYSLLKSYSVENVSSIMKHFPSLPYSDVFSTSDNESYVVTFIY